MQVEEFEFDFTYKVATYSVQVQRFVVDKEIHLWTVINRPRHERQIFTFYEGNDGVWSRPLNDKRDDVMKIVERPLAKKIDALKKKGKIKTYPVK
jgi:hypothetical protein